jgi:hypothetical protein
MPFRNAHELWTKLQDIYKVSNIIEDDCSPSTSSRDEFTTSSTSPTCDLSQCNDMVSGDRNCFVDGEYSIDYTSSLSHCNVLSLDLNSSSTPNVIHARVDSPCISCNSCLTKSHDDMLRLSCCHENNTSISSISCVANNVEESQHLLEQDVDLNGASSNSSPSLSTTHFCLMAMDSKVSPPLEPSTSCDDVDEDSHGEHMDVESITKKGEMVFDALPKGSKAIPPLSEIIVYAIKSREIIEDLETQFDEKCKIEREDAMEKASLENALKEEQELRVSLEEKLESLDETNDLIIAKIIKERDHALAKYKVLKKEKVEFGVGNARLSEYIERLDKAHKALESKHSLLIKSHDQLQTQLSKNDELAKLSTSISNVNDPCATNSTSCEASIFKENVELRAQLELLTSKYGKLKESHEKLSSSNEDLLASHARLKLAHEAIATKVTSCEPHVDNGTTSTRNAILPCASPSDSSSHAIAKSCDELLSLPCCSNNEVSTSSSVCVDTNHVEELNELKAQVTSLKKDLEKRHVGESTLDNMLSVQRRPNDKSGLGFNYNKKIKSKPIKKNKGQEQVKDSAKIVCFKCKVEGHHVRSCPLKKKSLSEKQQGKKPQVQTQVPQVEERPLPKKNHATPPQVKTPTKKR